MASSFKIYDDPRETIAAAMQIPPKGKNSRKYYKKK